MGQSKTLPLMTLIKRIYADLQREPYASANLTKTIDEVDQNLTADDADQTDLR
jgi:hypothetical protein